LRGDPAVHVDHLGGDVLGGTLGVLGAADVAEGVHHRVEGRLGDAQHEPRVLGAPRPVVAGLLGGEVAAVAGEQVTDPLASRGDVLADQGDLALADHRPGLDGGPVRAAALLPVAVDLGDGSLAGGTGHVGRPARRGFAASTAAGGRGQEHGGQ
jgi:hypothetical protein